MITKMSSIVPQRFMAWGPALLLSIEYINLGGWIGAIEAGSCFGPDLVVLILISGIAILCQYLATCIGIVTGKNLARICSEEYCRWTCMLLGVVAELSMIASDLSMIVSVAHGINLVFRLDLLKCIVFSATIVVLFPFFITLLESSKLELLYGSVSGFTLLFYVLGVLVSQAQGQIAIHHKDLRLNGETVCSIMALLGAYVKPHYLYSHSSIVQKQGRLPTKTIGASIHDQFFTILYSFIAISLVNYTLMKSAAGIVDDTGHLMPTYQDSLLFIDQIFTSPAAPLPFFLVFLFSSLITALTRNLGGKVILLNFFSSDLHILVHDIIVKSLAVIPALYCAQSAGTEGLYQLLLFSQIVLATLLPSSVILLFRVSSTRSIMGSFKIAFHLEMVTLFAFLTMLVLNVTFITRLSGNSSWIINSAVNIRSVMTLPSAILILLSIISLSFALHLAVTPLKSSNGGVDAGIYNWDLQKDQIQLSNGREGNSFEINVLDEDEHSVFELVPGDPMVEIHSDNLIVNSSLNLPEPIIDSDADVHKISPDLASTMSSEAVHLKNVVHPQETEPIINMGLVVVDEVCAINLLDEDVLHEADNKDSLEKNLGHGTDVYPNMDDKEIGASETPESTNIPPHGVSRPLKSSSTPSCSASESLSSVSTPTSDTYQPFQSFCAPTFDVLNSPTNVRGPRDNIGHSMEKFAMGCAARRRLTDILDVFWGHLFDYHGQLTDEAKSVRADTLLGLDIETTMSVKADVEKNGSFAKSPKELDIMLVLPTTLGAYTSPMQQKVPTEDLSHMVQKGYTSLSPVLQSLDVSSMRNDSFYNRGINADTGYDTITRTGPSSGYMNKFHNLCEVPELVNHTNGPWNDPSGCDSQVDRIYSDFLSGDEGVHSVYSRSKHKKGNFSKFKNMNTDPLQVVHPYEQSVNLAIETIDGGDREEANILPTQKKFFSYGESENIIITYLQSCLRKLWKLEGSVWLFTQNGGCDEELIDRVAAVEKLLNKENTNEVYQTEGGMVTDMITHVNLMHGCGDDCVWQAALVVSFGVWCVDRILKLLAMENRPELWGKYTYVLNRLQGIIDPAFSKKRTPLIPCKCLEIFKNHTNKLQNNDRNISRSQCTTAMQILEIIKEIEARISKRKGRSGTLAGDVAFPKGKANVCSVLKRYKRRLLKKSIYGCN